MANTTSNNDFILLMEYGLGGEIDGDNLRFREGCVHGKDCKYSTEHHPLVKQFGLGNGFRCWVNDDNLDRVECALAEGYGVMVDIWYDYAACAKARGKTPRQYADEVVDRCRKLVKQYGDKVWFNVFPEYDNHGWMSCPGPYQNREEAFQMLEHLYADAGKNFKTQVKACELFPPSDTTPGAAYISPYCYLRERGIKPEELNMVNLCCQTFSPHLQYKLGARAVWPEGNVGNSNQITIAFVRGAARQYGRHWCYDTAPFAGQDGPMPMAYDTRRRRISGFSESYILRAWLAAFISGAKTFLFQASDMGFFTRQSDGRLELSPIGEIGRDFSDFCLRRHPERGRARAPIALLLAQNHGYTPAFMNQERLFWGKLPDDRANRSIEAFFRLAFPGCGNLHGFSYDSNAWAPSSVPTLPQVGTTEGRPAGWANQQSWMRPGITTPDQFVRAFHEATRDGIYDHRLQEKPLLTNTIWGDSFDVLVDNAPLDVLKAYKGVILLGSIKVDDALRARLTAYVQSGGKVMLNTVHTTEADAGWLGIRFMNETGFQYYHAHSVLTGRLFNEGQYHYARVALNGAKALVEAGHLGATGNPLVTRHKLGRGEAWFVTAPDYQTTLEKMDLGWMESCKEAADEFIRPELSVEVQGPALEWIVNDAESEIRGQRSEVSSLSVEAIPAKADQRLTIGNHKSGSGPFWVTLINNSPETWGGRVTLKDALGHVTARDIWNEKAVPFEYDEQDRVVLKPEIARWEFKVVEIRPKRSP